MSDLELLQKCKDAAQSYSKVEEDVLVVCQCGEQIVFIGGNERDLPRFSPPVHLKPPGRPTAFPDMTPIEVRLGHCDEMGTFNSTNKMAVKKFLSLIN